MATMCRPCTHHRVGSEMTTACRGLHRRERRVADNRRRARRLGGVSSFRSRTRYDARILTPRSRRRSVGERWYDSSAFVRALTRGALFDERHRPRRARCVIPLAPKGTSRDCVPFLPHPLTCTVSGCARSMPGRRPRRQRGSLRACMDVGRSGPDLRDLAVAHDDVARIEGPAPGPS